MGWPYRGGAPRLAILLRRLKIAAALMALYLFVGTVGYRVAGLGWLDALYQTVITISTVGYADLAPNARPFTVLLVIIGPLSLALVLSFITAGIVESRLYSILGRRKVESRIRGLRNHFIICGAGRLGRTIATELVRKGADFVVIEKAAAHCEEARAQGLLVLEGDATEEQVLQLAGIEHARGLLTTLPSDADNVYVTITARQLAPRVTVVSIALDERTARKLKAAGASEVVAPYVLGGNWMAQLVTSPTVADFMKMATGANPVDFYMDEQRIEAHSALAGSRLKDTPIRSELGVIVVAVRRADGTLLTNPPGELALEAGDVLVSLGQHEQLVALKQLATPHPGASA